MFFPARYRKTEIKLAATRIHWVLLQYYPRCSRLAALGYSDSGAAENLQCATSKTTMEEGLLHVCPLSGQITRHNEDEKKKMEEMKASGQRGTRRAAEPESPTKGGVEPESRPQDFLHALIPPVRMASPNLPGDSLGVLGGGAVQGLGIREAKAPRRDHVPLGIGELENKIFAPPEAPGPFAEKSLPFKENPPPPLFPALFRRKPIFQPAPCCCAD